MDERPSWIMGAEKRNLSGGPRMKNHHITKHRTNGGRKEGHLISLSLLRKAERLDESHSVTAEAAEAAAAAREWRV